MKPVIEKIERNPNQSFSIRKFTTPCPQGIFHYHEEIELTYVINAKGKRFIAGIMEEFESGDLVLIGKNIPHYYQLDSDYPHHDILVLQFKDDFLGKNLFDIPELKRFGELCEKAKRGISFSIEDSEEIKKTLLAIHNMSNENRLFTLLDVFNRLMNISDYKFIGLPVEEKITNESDQQRIHTIYSFVANNFSDKILLEDVSALVNMTEPAFCRYFKKLTRNSFLTYLNEYRIGKACEELLKTEKNVALIAEESGFQNIANFNRQFKKVMNVAPSVYRKAIFENKKGEN
ncbi:AraC family transcriptional regulator [Sediminitomix flava]|uniref:AraC family transcriptional regulator n=1 Tax=Sediminitomix flava TaxID=379075 RepID=A0A315Z892_SEDFL|nr:AraC family transcriptional regulator [Sediminitomix flava]PWJ40145.1 AraC family transcriptional regulator [Sediminitomix flava]